MDESDSTAVRRDGGPSQATRILLFLIAVVVVGAALKATAVVTLPLVFAFFLIALFWPLYRRLERFVPAGVAAVSVLLAFVCFVAAVVAGVWTGIDRVLDTASDSSTGLSSAVADARAWAERHGLPFPMNGQSGSVKGLLERSGKFTFDVLGGFVLVIAFLVLGLLEIRRYRSRIKQSVGAERARRWLNVAERVTHDFQKYFVVRTVVGLFTGILTSLACWIVGIESPLLWGLINFLLNYVPTLGSILGVLPPTAFAFIQFDGVTMPLATLGAVGGVQLVMGNYVDPLLQGRYLSLSPVVVLFSVTFWGYIWGVAGALIGVPLTMIIVLVSREFDSTRWMSVLLSSEEKAETSTVSESARGLRTQRDSAASQAR